MSSPRRPVLVLALVAVSSPAAARRAGYQSTNCGSCHTGSGDVQLEVHFEPEQPSPGDRVTMTVSVTADGARFAGIAIGSNGLGQYALESNEPLEAEDIWVTHTNPKQADGGSVTFAVDWLAPDEPGIADFSVAVVAANGNGAPTGDRTTTKLVALPFGCDTVEVYADADGDGFGDPNRPAQVACAATEGYASRGNDCDDSVASTHPDAPELCNDVDDDCDGQVDEDVEYRPYYFDSDGDGYGNADVVIDGCAPASDTVDNDLDCNDFNRNVSPSSPELCDQIDNDCNGLIDDGSCGNDSAVPIEGAAAPTASTPAAVPAPDGSGAPVNSAPPPETQGPPATSGSGTESGISNDSPSAPLTAAMTDDTPKASDTGTCIVAGERWRGHDPHRRQPPFLPLFTAAGLLAWVRGRARRRRPRHPR